MRLGKIDLRGSPKIAFSHSQGQNQKAQAEQMWPLSV